MKVSDSGAGTGAPWGDEFADADELIADLAALLDAGLVVVHEPVLGPARYGIAPMRRSPRRRREEAYTAAA